MGTMGYKGDLKFLVEITKLSLLYDVLLIADTKAK